MAAGGSEAEWQRQVTALARRCGWLVFHVADSRRQVGARLVGDRGIAGWPDLTLVHPDHGLIFAELKAERGRLTPLQRDTLSALATATDGDRTRVHVWRPVDLMGVVIPVLRHGDGERVHGF
ncbi:MAG TPA: hypothetical protein PLC03_11345 [Microthrixaceae bacterium]|nr:hypothetical protein [Microthrixaceae bacterium]